MDPNTVIAIVGAGQMGVGIAQVAVQYGANVLLADQSQEHASKGKESLKAAFVKLVTKGRVTQSEAEVLLSRVRVASSLSECAQADLVFEAVSEKFEIKAELFRKLDSICKPSTIIATNTSSISITRIAAVTNRQDKVIGIHFMNPVPVMKLIEIIRGLHTSDETFLHSQKLVIQMDKTPVVARDFPGFIVNRILLPMINEAVMAVQEGVGSIEDIDTAMKLGTNQPMGPLYLADLIGLDTCLSIMEVLHEGLGDSKYRPSPLLRQYVQAGWLGKKTGRGFYRYDS